MHSMHSRSTTCCSSSSSTSASSSSWTSRPLRRFVARPVARPFFADADAAVDSSLLRRAPPSPLARSCDQEKQAVS